MPSSERISWLCITSSARRAFEELDAGSSPRFSFPLLVRYGRITGLFQLYSLCTSPLGNSVAQSPAAPSPLPPLSLPPFPQLLEPLLLLLDPLLLLPELLKP